MINVPKLEQNLSPSAEWCESAAATRLQTEKSSQSRTLSIAAGILHTVATLKAVALYSGVNRLEVFLELERRRAQGRP